MKMQDFVRIPSKHVPWSGGIVAVPAFAISVRPVTVGEFDEFVQSSGFVPTQERLGSRDMYRDNSSLDGLGQSEAAEIPAVFVSWTDAKAFCEWRGMRLPSELEWIAARFLEEDLEPDLKGKPVPFHHSLWEWTATLNNGNLTVLRDAPTRHYYRSQSDELEKRRKIVPIDATNISWCFHVVAPLDVAEG
jgi:hypothetical protein